MGFQSQNLWAGIRRVLGGDRPFADNYWYVGSGGVPRFGRRADTITDALTSMADRDVLFLGPGSYDEAVVWPIGKDRITIIGAGGRGDVTIVPSAANAIPMLIEGNATRTQDITLVNLGFETNGTGIGLHLLGNLRRVRIIDCKIEGGDVALKLESNAAGSIGDTRIERCELAWSVDAFILAVSGAGDPVTQTYMRDCLLHNFSSRGVRVTDTFTADLWLLRNMFARQEDGTEPTNEYVKADIASTTGFVSKNTFATATNAIAKLAIAAGVIWGPNGTEAGWSSARPA